jgi:DNA replication protein DnaC
VFNDRMQQIAIHAKHDQGRFSTDPIHLDPTKINASLPRKQLFELATCKFLDDARDVLLMGSPGTGKTQIPPTWWPVLKRR